MTTYYSLVGDAVSHQFESADFRPGDTCVIHAMTGLPGSVNCVIDGEGIAVLSGVVPAATQTYTVTVQFSIGGKVDPGRTQEFDWVVRAANHVNESNTEGDSVSLSLFPGYVVTSPSGFGPIGLTVSGGSVTGTIAGGSAAGSPHAVSVDVRGTFPGSTAQTVSFEWAVAEVVVTDGKHITFVVPDYDADSGGNQSTYLRLGNKNVAVEDEIWGDRAGGTPRSESDDNVGGRLSGWYVYTDGDYTKEVGGDVHNIHHGGSNDYFWGTQYGFSAHWDHEFHAGSKYESMFGWSGEVFVGGKFSSSIALEVECNMAAKIELGAGFAYQCTLDFDRTLSQEIEQEANNSIVFKVDPNDSTVERIRETWVPGIAAVVAGVGGLAATISAWSTKGADGALQTAAAASGVVYTAATVAAIADCVAWKKDRAAKIDEAVCELRMQGRGGPVGNSLLTRNGSAIESQLRTMQDGSVTLGNTKAGLTIKPDGTIVLANEKSALVLTKNGAVKLVGTTKVQVGMMKQAIKLEGDLVPRDNLSRPASVKIVGDNAITYKKDKVVFKGKKIDQQGDTVAATGQITWG